MSIQRATHFSPKSRAALATFIHQLIILTAVIFGGGIAVQVFSASGPHGATTVNIRKAVIKRSHFHG
ncbi:hypothetical protein [Streptomyces mirabilis]|uniref:hypothetical protein n=1 Tax=Streptomyces mirabilis TaxID=68239 RepID=UPI0036EAFBF7